MKSPAEIEAEKARKSELENALKRLLSANELDILGVEPSWRAEQLNLPQFLRIAHKVHNNNCNDIKSQ